MTINLEIARIRRDGGTQVRAELNDQTANEYADAIREGTSLPPVIVIHDGKEYWLADGFHRVEGALRAGKTHIEADVREGTLRDAIFYAAGANADHGLRRTNADKRKAVGIMLADPEWADWADREIARHCAVSNHLVAEVRALTGRIPSERRFVTKHGSTSTMATGAIGKSAEAEPAAGSTTAGVAAAPSATPPTSAAPAAAVAPAVAAPTPPVNPKKIITKLVKRGFDKTYAQDAVEVMLNEYPTATDGEILRLATEEIEEFLADKAQDEEADAKGNPTSASPTSPSAPATTTEAGPAPKAEDAGEDKPTKDLTAPPTKSPTLEKALSITDKEKEAFKASAPTPALPYTVEITPSEILVTTAITANIAVMIGALSDPQWRDEVEQRLASGTCVIRISGGAR